MQITPIYTKKPADLDSVLQSRTNRYKYGFTVSAAHSLPDFPTRLF